MRSLTQSLQKLDFDTKDSDGKIDQAIKNKISSLNNDDAKDPLNYKSNF